MKPGTFQQGKLSMLLKRTLVIGYFLGVVAAHASESYRPVDIDDIHSYWVPQKQVHKGHLFPSSAMRKHMDVCVAIGFTVEADGTPGNIRVLRSETSKPGDVEETKRVESAAMGAVSSAHYDAAVGNSARQPIFTYLTIAMAVANSGVTPAIAEKHNEAVNRSCRIADFVASANAGKIKPVE